MSQPVTRLGDMSTGHGPWLPRPNTGASDNVIANNLGVVRVGDTWAPHNGVPNGVHRGEIGISSSGSGTVFANNKAVVRIGDAIEGDTVAAGSGNVFAG